MKYFWISIFLYLHCLLTVCSSSSSLHLRTFQFNFLCSSSFPSNYGMPYEVRFCHLIWEALSVLYSSQSKSYFISSSSLLFFLLDILLKGKTAKKKSREDAQMKGKNEWAQEMTKCNKQSIVLSCYLVKNYMKKEDPNTTGDSLMVITTFLAPFPYHHVQLKSLHLDIIICLLFSFSAWNVFKRKAQWHWRFKSIMLLPISSSPCN